MAFKKDSKSLDSEQEKSQNEDVSLLKLKKLENIAEIESQTLELSKENEKDNENGFLDFGFNKSILNSLRNKGYKNPTPCLLYTSPSPRDRSVSRMPSSA